MPIVSPIDEINFKLGREHIERAYRHATPWVGSRFLDIGPSKERKEKSHPAWKTLDIVPGCDFQADITQKTNLPESAFDCVVCLDVLEHCLQPFDAIAEIRRILKPGGMLIASTPLNARIHGPIPDCWRFTEHGIKVLMRDWDHLEIDICESERFLFPVHYNWRAYCNKDKRISDEELAKQFRFIE